MKAYGTRIAREIDATREDAMMNYDRYVGAVLSSFLVGAAMGAMVALVLAPSSGKRLRRDITREGKKLAHRASETAERVRDKGADAYEYVREVAG
jgi:gas vesicle protein